jgi:hypothetical protein
MTFLDSIKSPTKIDKKTILAFLTYSNIVGSIILVIGLLLLLYAFESSLGLVIGIILISETWIVRFIYLFIIACIGGFLVYRAVKVIGFSRILATIFLFFGLGFLLVILRTAQVFIESYYQLTLFVLIGPFFFGIMVSIFLFIMILGSSFFIKSKKEKQQTTQQEKIQNTAIQEKTIVQNRDEQQEYPDSKQGYRICPKCLSKLSPEDVHCNQCGTLQSSND